MLSVLAVLLATGLVLAVGAWAATSGPDQVFAGDGPTPHRIITSAPSDTPSSALAGAADPAPQLEQRHDHGVPTWVRVLALLLRGALALVVLVGVGALLRRWWRTRRRHRPRVADPGEVDIAEIAPARRTAAAISADAGAQTALLAGGSPRNGIVACWQRFEQQAESAGSPRRSWETSSEFVVRLLQLVEADRTAVVRLGGLYRRARFSDHEVTEADRDAALEALQVIHAGLAAGVRSAP